PSLCSGIGFMRNLSLKRFFALIRIMSPRLIVIKTALVLFRRIRLFSGDITSVPLLERLRSLARRSLFIGDGCRHFCGLFSALFLQQACMTLGHWRFR